jgi:hypothetical protein
MELSLRADAAWRVVTPSAEVKNIPHELESTGKCLSVDVRRITWGRDARRIGLKKGRSIDSGTNWREYCSLPFINECRRAGAQAIG